jgi:hypothetical protein
MNQKAFTSGQPAKWCVCVCVCYKWLLAVMGVYIESKGWFHRLRRDGSVEVDGRTTTTWPAGHALWMHHLYYLRFLFAAS